MSRFADVLLVLATLVELGNSLEMVCETRRFIWSYHKVLSLPNRRNKVCQYKRQSIVSKKPPAHGTSTSVMFLLNWASCGRTLNAGVYVCHQNMGGGLLIVVLYFNDTTITIPHWRMSSNSTGSFSLHYKNIRLRRNPVILGHAYLPKLLLKTH